MGTRALMVSAAGAAVLCALAHGSPADQQLVVPGLRPSIQEAIDAARPGGEVRLQAGTFREQVVIVTRDGEEPILLSGEEGAVIDGGDGPAIRVTGGGDVLLSGFSVTSARDGIVIDGGPVHATLEGVTASLCGRDGFSVGRANVTIRNCASLLSGRDGIHAAGAAVVELPEGCIVDGSGRDGVRMNAPAGRIQIGPSLIRNSGAAGIRVQVREGVIGQSEVRDSKGVGIQFVARDLATVGQSAVRRSGGPGIVMRAGRVNLFKFQVDDAQGNGVVASAAEGSNVANGLVQRPRGIGILWRAGAAGQGRNLFACVVQDAGSDGIRAVGDGMTLRGNTVRQAGGRAIRVVGGRAELEGNVVE